MDIFETTSSCPKCGHRRLKDWKELSEDERTAALVMPASAEFTVEERKHHRFCTRCWYEEEGRPETA